MESSKETGFQASEGPTFCINNCGFFGSAATMNMCSKCHKDMVLKKEQAQLAASSIENFVNGSTSNSPKEPTGAGVIDVKSGPVDLKLISSSQASPADSSSTADQSEARAKVKEGPNRCNTCRKRVGLTGFTCKCGNLFCATHRYSDKHECPYDYQNAGRDAIAKANPVVVAKKLDKI